MGPGREECFAAHPKPLEAVQDGHYIAATSAPAGVGPGGFTKMRDIRRNLLLCFAVAVALGPLHYYIDQAFIVYGLSAVDRAIDDLVIGFLVGTALFFVMVLRSERESRVQERLILIAELNHHVRNALTTIVLYAEYPDLKQRLLSTTQAVERIEWVLRELVPTAALRGGKPRLLDEEG